MRKFKPVFEDLESISPAASFLGIDPDAQAQCVASAVATALNTVQVSPPVTDPRGYSAENDASTEGFTMDEAGNPLAAALEEASSTITSDVRNLPMNFTSIIGTMRTHDDFENDTGFPIFSAPSTTATAGCGGSYPFLIAATGTARLSIGFEATYGVLNTDRFGFEINAQVFVGDSLHVYVTPDGFIANVPGGNVDYVDHDFGSHDSGTVRYGVDFEVLGMTAFDVTASSSLTTYPLDAIPPDSFHNSAQFTWRLAIAVGEADYS